MEIPKITAAELMARYQVILLDAYGVLIDQKEAFAGAREFIEHLNRIDKKYFILTNDASKYPTTVAEKYRKMGLTIEVERIITSGSLLPGYFRENQLTGSRCVVLGPEDCYRYLQQVGCEIISPEEDSEVDALIVCDEAGYPLLETVDATLSMLIRKLDRGETVPMILPNPDLIYPKKRGHFGITGGSIALILEEALKLRYPGRKNLSFARLGKPYAPIYREALARSGTKNMVMVGDQIATDIRGAYEFGIHSALVGTGLTNLQEIKDIGPIRPTYILSSLTMA